MHGGNTPPEYEDLILMREANLKPWDLEDPRFTAEMRSNIIACLSGEQKAKRVGDQPIGLIE